MTVTSCRVIALVVLSDTDSWQNEQDCDDQHSGSVHRLGLQFECLKDVVIAILGGGPDHSQALVTIGMALINCQHFGQ